MSPATAPATLPALLDLLSECDQAIIAHDDETSMATAVAQVLVQSGWWVCAWLGRGGNGESPPSTLAAVGPGAHSVALMPAVCRACQALSTCRGGTSPGTFSPCESNTHSPQVLPLCAQGTCWGVLALVPTPGVAWPDEMQPAWTRLATHLGHALRRFEALRSHQAAQGRVQQAQQLTQAFIDHLPGTVFLKDERLRLRMVNRHLAAALQVPADELIGRDNHQLFPADFADRADALDRTVLENGQTQTVPQSFGGRQLETRLFVVQGHAGERLLGGISLDVTERHSYQQRAQALLALHEMAVSLDERSLLTEGLERVESITQSRIGFLHFVNDDQETLELVTWTRGALGGCTAAHDSHYPISSAGVWADCFRQRAPVVVNDYAGHPHKHGLPAGHATLVRFVSVPVIEGERICMMLGVGNKATPYNATDVETLQLLGNELWRMAQRRRVEQALQERLRELEAANAQLADMQLHLLQTEKMASIGQLAAGVAHEINNPIGFVRSNLGALAGYAQGLVKVLQAYEAAEASLGTQQAPAFEGVHAAKADTDHDFARAEMPQLITESQDGIERVRKIVQDLKNFSRSGDTDWQWADLTDGLESTINMVWNQIKYKAELRREYQPLPQVYCVASQINQVVMNLLVNAAQAIEQQGTITVRTGASESDVWIEVEDTGCGMNAADLKRVFEPFFTTKPPGQGTGLGLAIAWRVMQRHRGHIDIQSEPGHGSCFRVQWPIDHRQNPTPTDT